MPSPLSRLTFNEGEEKFFAGFEEAQRKLEKEREMKRKKEMKETLRKIRNWKKPKQTKMKQYYKETKNSEGHPMKHCYYEPSVKDYVFIPPGHGEKFAENCIKNAKPKFCLSCRLKPCIITEYWYELEGDCDGYECVDSLGKEEIRSRLYAQIQTIFEGYFGKRRWKKMCMPSCVHQYINEKYPESGSFSSEEESEADGDQEVQEIEQEEEAEFEFDFNQPIMGNKNKQKESQPTTVHYQVIDTSSDEENEF